MFWTRTTRLNPSSVCAYAAMTRCISSSVFRKCGCRANDSGHNQQSSFSASPCFGMRETVQIWVSRPVRAIWVHMDYLGEPPCALGISWLFLGIGGSTACWAEGRSLVSIFCPPSSVGDIVVDYECAGAYSQLGSCRSRANFYHLLLFRPLIGWPRCCLTLHFTIRNSV